MQALFLGGTQEIGASCLALELAGHWIIIDAGVRVGPYSILCPDFKESGQRPSL